MCPVDGEHVGVDLGAVDRTVAEQLADDFQRPAMQQQVNGKLMPERVATDSKRRPSPYSLHQVLDVPVHGLARHRKKPLALFELPRPQVTLDPVLQHVIEDRHIALGGALQHRLTRPPRALLQGF